MAYKFQLGAATMSGSLKQEGTIDIEDNGELKVQGTKVIDASRNVTAVSLSSSNTLQVGGAITAAGTVALNGVADTAFDLGADSLYFRDADGSMKREAWSDMASSAAGSGLAAASGVLSVDLSELSAAVVNVAADSIVFLDADGNATVKDTFADYATAIAGTGLKADAGVLEVRVSGSIIRASDKLGITGSIAGSGLGYDGGVNSINELSVNVDDSSIEINSDSLRVKADGIQTAMLNDNVISGQDELAQGGLVAADEFLISDGGTLKRYGVDSLAKDLGALTSEAAIANGDYLMFLDGGSTGETKKEAVADLATLFAGDGLSAASSVLAVAVSGAVHIESDKVAISGSIAGDGLGYNGGVDSILSLKVQVDDSSVELSSDALRVKADGITGAMLNDDVISSQTELAADGLAAADEFMISDGGTLKKIGADTLFSDGPGLLSAAAIAVGSDHFMFLDGGATGDAKIESIADLMTAVAGTTSATALIAADGVLSLDIDALSAETIATGDTIAFNDDGDDGLHKVTFDNMITKALPLLTEAAITVADDYVVFLDGGVSGDGKKEKWADIVAAIAGGGLTATNGVLSTDAASAAAIGDTNSMLSEGMNFGSNTLTADRTWTLPGSPTVGDVVHVKAPGNLGGFDLTVQRSGSTSHTIDGQTSIELESNGAAVSLMYVAANNWVIF